jgi:hypothetical protein
MDISQNTVIFKETFSEIPTGTVIVSSGKKIYSIPQWSFSEGIANTNAEIIPSNGYGYYWNYSHIGSNVLVIQLLTNSTFTFSNYLFFPKSGEYEIHFSTIARKYPYCSNPIVRIYIDKYLKIVITTNTKDTILYSDVEYSRDPDDIALHNSAVLLNHVVRIPFVSNGNHLLSFTYQDPTGLDSILGFTDISVVFIE